MARPLRMGEPDSWHPVVNRGNLRTDNERCGVHGGRRLSKVVGRIAGLKYPSAGLRVNRIKEHEPGTRHVSGLSGSSGTECRSLGCDPFISVTRRFRTTADGEKWPFLSSSEVALNPWDEPT